MKSRCFDCANKSEYDRLVGEFMCSAPECNHFSRFVPKNKPNPLTNYARLISKTPEEIAEFINGVETDGRAYGPRGKREWLNWLKEKEEKKQRINNFC